MRSTSLRLLGLVTCSILCVNTNATTLKRAQITFPPSTGPCRQNHGLEPLQCSDNACIDIAASGVCHIQTQEGLPLCGCCDFQITLLCSACGGDAGDGICLGTGLTGLSFQGCPCTANGGAVTGGGQTAVCPEHTGSDTQPCRTSACGGNTRYAGLCDSSTDIGGGSYQFCACCPDEDLACSDCGGDKGDGRCKGVDKYTGKGYDNCKCSSDPGSASQDGVLYSRLTPNFSGNHPVIIPFPIPPPGFPIPPPGTPNPEEPCLETIDTKCAECDGKNKWCQTGRSAGCPCQDDQQECLDGDNVPNCSDANCGGATSTSIISTCKGANNENKDCTCFQFEPEPEPYAPFSDQQLLEQEAFLSNILAAPATPTSSTPPVRGIGELTCSANSASQVLKEMIWSDGSKTPNQVLYTLREAICTNRCGMPAGLPTGIAWKTGSKDAGDCEIAIAIEGGIEAYFYSGTPSTNEQWQQCWDSTDAIIKKCVNEGPNTGWVNGPNPYQFYQGGFRPLNGDGAIHAPMSGNALRSKTAIAAVTPSNAGGFTCGSGVGGTRPLDCLAILASIINGEQLSNTETNPKFCTDDATCLKKGESGSSDGSIVYSSYCEVASNSGCSFVIASKLASFGGVPGRSCVSPKDMSEFIRLGANECGPNQSSGVWVAGYALGETSPPYTVYGLVNAANPGVLFV